MPQTYRMLISDKDPLIRSDLVEQFSLLERYQIFSCVDEKELQTYVEQERLDLLLLNLYKDARSVSPLIRAVRESGYMAPIILLIPAPLEVLGKEAIDEGADDYMLKPTRFSSLLSRLQTQLKQYEISDDTSFPLGPFVFKPGAKALINQDNEKIRLTEKEVAVLRYLYRAAGSIVLRDVLLTEVWGYNAAVSTHTLETHIYRLRQKIEADCMQASILLTEPGGYRLVV